MSDDLIKKLEYHISMIDKLGYEETSNTTSLRQNIWWSKLRKSENNLCARLRMIPDWDTISAIKDAEECLFAGVAQDGFLHRSYEIKLKIAILTLKKISRRTSQAIGGIPVITEDQAWRWPNQDMPLNEVAKHLSTLIGRAARTIKEWSCQESWDKGTSRQDDRSKMVSRERVLKGLRQRGYLPSEEVIRTVPHSSA